MSSNAHFFVGGERIVLPFVALQDFAYRQPSFSLNRTRDQERALAERKKILRDVGSWDTAPNLDKLSIVIRLYGSSKNGSNANEICPRLSSQWAKAVCDNPWAALRQALPHNRFALVDLRKLNDESMRNLLYCKDSTLPVQIGKISFGQASLICEADIYSSQSRFFTSVIPIRGNLGAIWRVWEGAEHHAETAIEMANREGQTYKMPCLPPIFMVYN